MRVLVRAAAVPKAVFLTVPYAEIRIARLPQRTLWIPIFRWVRRRALLFVIFLIALSAQTGAAYRHIDSATAASSLLWPSVAP